MAIVKFTEEELRAKYPMTPERMKEIHEVCMKYEDVEIDDADCSEVTDEMFARATRPAHSQATEKEPVTLYLPAAILATWRRSGRNWQSRLNNKVEEWLEKTACA
jgi:uncharacterized protein (DUF4415 family)